MVVKLLTEHHLEFLSLIGGCCGLSESTHVKPATLLEISCTGSFFLVVKLYRGERGSVPILKTDHIGQPAWHPVMA